MAAPFMITAEIRGNLSIRQLHKIGVFYKAQNEFHCSWYIPPGFAPTGAPPLCDNAVVLHLIK